MDNRRVSTSSSAETSRNRARIEHAAGPAAVARGAHVAGRAEEPPGLRLGDARAASGEGAESGRKGGAAPPCLYPNWASAAKVSDCGPRGQVFGAILTQELGGAGTDRGDSASRDGAHTMHDRTGPGIAFLCTAHRARPTRQVRAGGVEV